MNPSRQHIDYLWMQFVQDKASWKELQELLQYLQNNPDNSYDIGILEQYLATHTPSTSEIDVAYWKEKLTELRANPVMSASLPARVRTYSITRWVAAASVLIAAAVLFFLNTKQETHSGENLTLITSDRSPQVEQGAILTLADGRQILLDSAGNGLISGNDPVKVFLRDNQLVYEHSSQSGYGDYAAINTLSTPRGRQFSVDLPDGSKAWLNAASSLSYPTRFQKDKREVSVTGEVYFEVAKTSAQNSTGTALPFIVKTPAQTIEVLGTVFNVNCYAEEEAEKTTLLQGSVRVTGIKGSKPLLLSPGQQAIVKGIETSVIAANIDAVTDWHHGKFYFNNDNIQTIMRKISRLYDVEVEYQDINKTANTNFVGSVNRFSDVSEILRKLELTGTIKFKKDGNKILVIP